MRVVYLNMTDSSQQSPGDLAQRTDSGKRTCGRQLYHSACSAPVIYTTAAVKQYSKVCGMIRANHPGAPQPPAFVGNDYFCDTGSSGVLELKFYGDNPLWDGACCGSQSTCCSLNTPPQAAAIHSTTDDIEMRLCRSESGNNAEDILQ